MKFVLTLATAAALAAAPIFPALSAPQIARVGPANFPISSTVVVHDAGGVDIAFASGAPGSTKAGDTKAQTVDSLTKLLAGLKAQGFGAGDVVMLRVYLVGDPAKDAKMDFAGMMAGYTQFFGSADQPNKPARTTVQIAGLASPGSLVEIEAEAIKPRT